MATVNGATLMARSLKQQGVDYMFGIVGFPVVPIAMAAQKEGITFIGMRNEQAASYATQAAGYLLGRPQACLVVSGPGVIHALSGLANAQQNNWPMILIGGASGIDQNGMGALPGGAPGARRRRRSRSTATSSSAPTASRTTSSRRCARPGTAGPARPTSTCPTTSSSGVSRRTTCRLAATIPPPPRSQAADADVAAALAALQTAERPLVIVGKGMAWSRAEDEVRAVRRDARACRSSTRRWARA